MAPADATRPALFARLVPTTPGERVAVALVLAAIAFTAVMWLRLLPLGATLEEFRASVPCSATVTEDCVLSRPSTITAAPNGQRRIGVGLGGPSERFTIRLRDDQSPSALSFGTPVVVRSWRGDVVDVAVAGDSIQTDRHPERILRTEEPWVAVGGIATVITLVIAYCVAHAARNARAPRDASVRAGAYAVPYVAGFRSARAVVAFLVVAGVVLVAVAIWVAPRWGAVMLALDVLMLLMVLVLSRSHVTLGADSVSYRRISRERVVRYADIESVARAQRVFATGKGVVVLSLLRIGLRGGGAAEMDVTLLCERDRAVVVDRLQRMATNATFAPDLHVLWTGSF